MEISEHGNFGTWKFQNMEILEHRNFGTWKFQNMVILEHGTMEIWKWKLNLVIQMLLRLFPEKFQDISLMVCKGWGSKNADESIRIHCDPFIHIHM